MKKPSKPAKKPFHFRLSTSEKNQLRQFAEKEGITMSEWVRCKVRKEYARVFGKVKS